MGQIQASLYNEVNIISGKARGLGEQVLTGETRDVADVVGEEMWRQGMEKENSGSEMT